ncbi:phosphatidylglycerophosphatase A [Halioxenophilus sp. WMMB6]|uniref:phosphatidylglycerophosphatase A family protein n=1 Tax=Halioxenophilus sp. WMMB6 TaxID=3073815 RepID=UPI00295F0AD3|nr:phosphatidylglycerophosphatase A [Halioxenophilus sp. WMMB6]
MASFPPVPSFAQLVRSPVLLLAFGFGSGCARKAPGTFGTLAALPLTYLLLLLPLPGYLAVVLLAGVLGIWICHAASRKLEVHDHPGIVWDEFVGLWVTCIALPAGWWWPLLGFGLFRLFDIAKPWPISWLDRHVHGGLGIMIDDILAGLFAAVVIQLLALILS